MSERLWSTDRDPRLRWWREIVYVLVFYGVYSWIRNQFGSSGNFSATSASALRNAEWVIDVERAIGLFFEEKLQQAFDGWGWFYWFWNVFYGSLHFVITTGVMVYLYRRFPLRYQRFRTALAVTTGLALFGFALFPLMPPRLLAAGDPYGADLVQYGFIDTLAEHGGLWSFDSGTMSAISNQWAAMPSLHLGWATWCAIALAPVLTQKWARAAMITYPVLTLFAVVVTANHYWIDGLGGVMVLSVGLYAGSRWVRRLEQRHCEAARAADSVPSP
ncbi:MAG: phosphatase PAP2 family protein [Actinomycetota bacterium]|nr:phosphatase PAP2 family protein [Actinomycetota bacterium]